ncbi:hypothetical protein DOY81_005380, partial [Sarcophaga bullata]
MQHLCKTKLLISVEVNGIFVDFNHCASQLTVSMPCNVFSSNLTDDYYSLSFMLSLLNN